MLRNICIKNFIIVDKLELELGSGFNVFSGETGAGKSIILDAFGLAFGNRAEQGLVRQGAKHCDISLEFTIDNRTNLINWLEEHGFDAENECILHRRITAEGKSKAMINGLPATLTLVRELAQLLVQAHSQHQHQLLQKPKKQQELLDHFGKHHDLLEQCKQHADTYHTLNHERELLLAKSANRDDEQPLLAYQVEELNNLDLKPDEWQTLTKEHKKLHQAKGLLESISQSVALLEQTDESNALNCLQQAQENLNAFDFDDANFTNAKTLLNSAIIHTQEALAELNQFQNQLDISPERLSEIESRMSLVYDLARKHHINAEELPQRAMTLEKKLEALMCIDSDINAIDKKLEDIKKDYQSVANKLSAKRKKTALKLEKQVTEFMQMLNMPKSQFAIKLCTNNQSVHHLGQEQVEFWLTTNPGQPLQAMSRVASGGELSRILLAIHACLGASDIIPTLVFDEIDAGISGKTADAVARVTKTLSSHHQIIAITHLPQVAARASNHFLVEKTIDDNTTHTHIRALNKKEHIEEVARMLSGEHINKSALTQAKALIEQD